MSVSRALAETRRVVAGARRPALVLLAVSLAAAPVPAHERPEPALARAMSTALEVAVVAAAVWLVATLGYAAMQPRRDALSAARLTLLRDGAGTPGCALLQVASTTWTGPAGQRALCVDVAVGATYDLWFPEAHHPVAAFVLARLDR